MNNWHPTAGFKWFALCSLALMLKLFAVAFLSPMARARHRVRVNPEDVGEGHALLDVEPPTVARASRIHRNDLENIPAFWMVGLLAVAAGVQGPALIVCSASFTLSRFGHTLCYWGGFSKGRTLCFMVGMLSVLALGATVAVRLL